MRAATAIAPRSLVGGPSLTKTGVVLGGGLLLVLLAGTVALALGSVGVGIGDGLGPGLRLSSSTSNTSVALGGMT